MDTADDPLQAALAHAFEESPIIANSSTSPSIDASTSRSLSVTTVERPVAATTSADIVQSGGSDESWKDDLERLSASWRAESAVAREKAERERERWRILREQEAAAAQVKTIGKKESEWEDVINPLTAERSHATLGEIDREQISATRATTTNFNTADVNKQQFSTTDNTLPQDNIVHPQSNFDDQTLFASKTWDDVPSLDSSFPSFSMHDPSPPASDPRERPPYQQPSEPPSMTLSIFDHSLSCRTRILALMSSMAINLFLPFVNGVMLGFGEIFAKNVVGYFGWEMPGTGLGIHASFRRKRE